MLNTKNEVSLYQQLLSLKIFSYIFFTKNNLVHNVCILVSGMCHGILAGEHTVTYRVGACLETSIANAGTGFRSSFHIFIEELRVDLVKVCELNPVLCDGS